MLSSLALVFLAFDYFLDSSLELPMEVINLHHLVFGFQGKEQT